jgi:glucuronoarabinoxylan endo-1,4-beta-xylanase
MTVAAVASANFVANFSATHQTIDGFGGSDAFSNAYGTPLINALYCVNSTDTGCSGPGIGLTLLRVAVGCCPMNNALDVTARGGKVWATGWGTGDPNNPSGYDAIAEIFRSWASGWINGGVPLYGLAAQNEPDCGCNNGSFWTSDKHANFQAILGPKIHGLGLKLIAPEVAFPQNFAEYVGQLELYASTQVDILSYHEYGPTTPTGQASDYGTRHIWETEICDCSGWDPSIGEAVQQSQKQIMDSMNFGANAWHSWWLISGGSGTNDNSGLLGGSDSSNIELTKRYFALGNWSKFVRPGWVRIGVTGSKFGIYGAAAFKDPVSGKFAIVAINDSGADIPNVTFGITGASFVGTIAPYVTSNTTIGALGSDGNLSAGSSASGVPAALTASGGVFTSVVPSGVITFVGSTQ